MNEWIEWKGGNCPVPSGTRIAVKWRLMVGEIDNVVDYTDDPQTFHWGHDLRAGDIVAYKVLEEE